MGHKVRNAAGVGGWYKVLCLPDSSEILMGQFCYRGDCPATTDHLLFLLVCLNLFQIISVIWHTFCSLLKFLNKNVTF